MSWVLSSNECSDLAWAQTKPINDVKTQAYQKV